MNPANEQIAKLKAQVAKLKSRIDGIEAESFIKVREGGLLEQTDDINNLVKDIEKTLSRVATRGAVFAKGGPLETSLQNAAMFMNKFLGSTKPATEAFNALMGSFQQFGTLAETELGPGMDLYADKMTTLAATLREMGLSYSDFNKNVELATYTLNLSAKEVLNLNQGIVDFAKEIKMLPSVVSQNFQLVAKAMAYNAPMIQNEFKKIQQLSATTGVSVGTLMSGFGQKLDTLSGASAFAGKLNSILGQVVFSPNEILMMSESDRMVKVREAIMRHPIYGEIKSGSKLGVFALDTIRGLTGYSREDARRFLLFGDQPGSTAGGSLKTKLGRKANEAFDAPGQANKALTELATGMTSFTKQLEANVETLMRIGIIPKTQQGLVYDRRMFTPGGMLTNQPFSSDIETFTDAGLTLEFGQNIRSKTGIGRGAKDALPKAINAAPMLIDVLRILQTLPDSNRGILAGKVEEMLQDYHSKKIDPAELNRRTARIRATAIAFDLAQAMDDVTPAEATFIKILRDKSAGRLGISRDFLRFFRTENNKGLKGLTGKDKEARLKEMMQRAGISNAEFEKMKSDPSVFGGEEGGKRLRDITDALENSRKSSKASGDDDVTTPSKPGTGVPGFTYLMGPQSQVVIASVMKNQRQEASRARRASRVQTNALVGALNGVTGVLKTLSTSPAINPAVKDKLNETIVAINAHSAALKGLGDTTEQVTRVP